MISKSLYDKISTTYGPVGSWAVWNAPADKPTSNMGYEDIFDLRKNPSLLDILNNQVVMVALNFSRAVEFKGAFANFHDTYSRAKDFKIRHAFTGTEFYGAYMTDIIKNLVDVDSGQVMSRLRGNPELIDTNITKFRKELADIEARKPLLLAFGINTYTLLMKHLERHEYSHLIRLTHYSHFVGKEKYREQVLSQIHQSLSGASQS
jgi:hypothetical protein